MLNEELSKKRQLEPHEVPFNFQDEIILDIPGAEEIIFVPNNDEIISDIQDAISDLPGVQKTSDVTPRDKLMFAKQILFCSVILFVLSFVMSAMGFSAIFESCKAILPPIATLVIGYYFGAVK